jgi:NAD(P)-dependent dehydrogenase (short-subunit alcohol dehydrogenase family)
MQFTGGDSMGVLNDKVAIVTGGGRGIGWGVTQLFSDEGATVVMMGRNPDTLHKAEKEIKSQGGNALGMPGDISKVEDVQHVVDSTVKAYGKIDILVANAGINPVTPFLEIPEEEWDACLNVNLKGSFLCIQRVGRVMAKAGQGRIVVIGSVDGAVVVPGEAHYGASKAGLLHLSKIAAVELIRHGVYLNHIACGWVYTDLVKEELDQPERLEYWLSHIPAHRIGTIEELAQATLFLARDDVGNFTVGANLTIDGGAGLLMDGMMESWGA